MQTAGAALRYTLLVACVVMLLGHVCVPLELESDAVTLAAGSVAEASGDHGHQASCEALPRSSVGSSASLAGGTPILGCGVPTAESAEVRQALAPIPRPPRFLLFASLLN
jgi:hypothetical protein